MANKYFFYALTAFMVSIGFFIISFDIGSHIPLSIYNMFKSIIPSISSVAEITKYSSSSELFLIFSWLFVIPSWFMWGKFRSSFEFDIGKMLKNQPPWTIVLSYFVSLGLLVGSALVTPTAASNDGMYSRPIVYCLVNYKYFIVLYGLALHFMIFAIVSFLFGAPLYLYNKFLSKGE